MKFRLHEDPSGFISRHVRSDEKTAREIKKPIKESSPKRRMPPIAEVER
jgi:hypothetical protein